MTFFKNLFKKNTERKDRVNRFLDKLSPGQLVVLNMSTDYPQFFQGVLSDALEADLTIEYYCLLRVIGAPHLQEFKSCIDDAILRRGGI